MKNKFKTPQENFWAGDFGNDYIDRNKGDKKAEKEFKKVTLKGIL